MGDKYRIVDPRESENTECLDVTDEEAVQDYIDRTNAMAQSLMESIESNGMKGEELKFTKDVLNHICKVSEADLKEFAELRKTMENIYEGDDKDLVLLTLNVRSLEVDIEDMARAISTHIDEVYRIFGDLPIILPVVDAMISTRLMLTTYERILHEVYLQCVRSHEEHGEE